MGRNSAVAAESQSALLRSTGAHQNPSKSSAPAVAAVILLGPSSAVAAASRFEVDLRLDGKKFRVQPLGCCLRSTKLKLEL